jgi:hypothetical protein
MARLNAPTVAPPAPHSELVVLAAAAAQEVAAKEEPQVHVLCALAAEHGARAEALSDGGVVAIVTGAKDPAELCAGAARLALGWRAQAPKLIVVITSAPELQRARADAIDGGARKLDKARVAAAVVGGGEGIQVDEWVAAHLEKAFTLSRVGKAIFLVAPRS